MSRRFWLALGAAAAALLGFDRFIVPIAPGPDLELHWATSRQANKTVISFVNDAGDIKGWLRVTVDPARAIGAVDARLSNHLPLSALHRPAAPTLDIGAAGTIDGSVQQFTWPAGTSVDVVLDSMAVGITDWVVFTDKGSDSQKKARWRTMWHRLLLGLVVLAVIGGVLGTLRPEPVPVVLPMTAHVCVTAIIDGMSADDSIKTFLRKLLIDRTGQSEALEALNASKISELQKMILVFTAQRMLKERLNNLIQDLDGFVLHLP